MHNFGIIRVVNFDERYKKLNLRQKQAVDTTEGPLMVIAGPGTGKTELLSMRAANILKTTDTLAQNILCLTFTEQGAEAMRRRMIDITGPDGYRIAVHTFHGFAADVASRFRHYFYAGAELAVADTIQRYQILSNIVESLDFNNPFKLSFGGEYTSIGDIQTAISEIKRSGLTEDELQAVIEANDVAVGAAERAIREAIGVKISKTSLDNLREAVQAINAIDEPQPQSTIPRLSHLIAESLQAAINEASNHPRVTPPLTAWKNTWCTKNANGELTLKSRSRLEKLHALLPIYREYRRLMNEARLQDFDDLILELIHVMETQPEVRFELQEQYLYIMVDEFQDTNLAQMRILDNLTNNPVNEGRPNLMVVGDDDQAIFSFQGANVGNVMTFLARFHDEEPIVLTDNYRSPEAVLSAARNVITQGVDRLEANLSGISKSLTPHTATKNTSAKLIDFATANDEQAWIARQINEQITAGHDPSEIAVIAKKHADLEALLPHLASYDIPLSYEKRENVLENESVHQLILLARVIAECSNGNFDAANIALAELLAHPAWQVSTETLWNISLKAHQTKSTWFELLPSFEETSKIEAWLQQTVRLARTMPLEHMLDRLIGHDEPTDEYCSPLKRYFFADITTSDDANAYLEHLDSLYAIREKLRNHFTEESTVTLEAFLHFIDLHRATGSKITRLRRYGDSARAVNLLTAHGSKGLEFDTVYVINAIDSQWGHGARSKVPLITYPENLRLREKTNSPEERLRLFYVAMTRSKRQLFVTYSHESTTAKQQLLASFLVDNQNLKPTTIPLATDQTTLITTAELHWHDRLVQLPAQSLQSALSERLRTYKLSATDFCAFLDVTKGGPRGFLINNLLHFPSAMSPAASYGSAFHAVLQRAHSHIASGHQPLPEEDLLHLFEQELRRYPLSETDLTHYLARGTESLHIFLAAEYGSFRPSQLAELNFANQHVTLGEARLKGKLDIVDIDKAKKTIAVIDYKTGSAFSDWGKGTVYDKLKSHHYSQQLLFYELLIKHSRDYHTYTITESAVQFVEPNKAGVTPRLTLTSTPDDHQRLTSLIHAVWKKIMAGDFPETGHYTHDSKGIIAFEDDLLASA